MPMNFEPKKRGDAIKRLILIHDQSGNYDVFEKGKKMKCDGEIDPVFTLRFDEDFSDPEDALLNMDGESEEDECVPFSDLPVSIQKKIIAMYSMGRSILKEVKKWGIDQMEFSKEEASYIASYPGEGDPEMPDSELDKCYDEEQRKMREVLGIEDEKALFQ